MRGGVRNSRQKMDRVDRNNHNSTRSCHLSLSLVTVMGDRREEECPTQMFFHGQDLQNVTASSASPTELRSQYFRRCRTIFGNQAFNLDLELFMYAGNRCRIALVRQRVSTNSMKERSRFTDRLKDASGKHTAQQLVPEYRPLQDSTR